MGERKHAVLAPSSKEWINCGFSAKFLSVKKEETNEASEFGTECHALGEYYIKENLALHDYQNEGKVTLEELKKSFKHYTSEMDSLAKSYANFVISRYRYEERRTGKKPVILIEQRIQMDYAPDTFGTLDCGIIADDVLTIVDLKTGRLKQEAYDKEKGGLNTQLGIYGLYTYKAYKEFYPIKNVEFVIHQERIGHICEYSMTVEELLDWEQTVLIPASIEAQKENAQARVGWWCKYCPGRNVCKSRVEEEMAIAEVIKKPELMTDREIQEILPRLDDFITFATDLKEYCLKKALNGKKWNGFKLVEANTRRKIENVEAVAEILMRNGIDPYKKELLAISELQKIIGKKMFDHLVGEYVIKPKGKAVLAPETDVREEIKIGE